MSDDEFARVEAIASPFLQRVTLRELQVAVKSVDPARFRMHYLATPYTKLSTGVGAALADSGLNFAARSAGLWVAQLAREGVTAVSPIQSAHNACRSQWVMDDPSLLDPLDADFWYAWCAPILAVSASVIIPPIAGWRDSVGVAQEAVTALETERPVYVLAASV